MEEGIPQKNDPTVPAKPPPNTTDIFTSTKHSILKFFQMIEYMFENDKISPNDMTPNDSDEPVVLEQKKWLINNAKKSLDDIRIYYIYHYQNNDEPELAYHLSKVPKEYYNNTTVIKSLSFTVLRDVRKFAKAHNKEDVVDIFQREILYRLAYAISIMASSFANFISWHKAEVLYNINDSQLKYPVCMELSIPLEICYRKCMISLYSIASVPIKKPQPTIIHVRLTHVSIDASGDKMKQTFDNNELKLFVRKHWSNDMKAYLSIQEKLGYMAKMKATKEWFKATENRELSDDEAFLLCPAEKNQRQLAIEDVINLSLLTVITKWNEHAKEALKDENAICELFTTTKETEWTVEFHKSIEYDMLSSFVNHLVGFLCNSDNHVISRFLVNPGLIIEETILNDTDTDSIISENIKRPRLWISQGDPFRVIAYETKLSLLMSCYVPRKTVIDTTDSFFPFLDDLQYNEEALTEIKKNFKREDIDIKKSAEDQSVNPFIPVQEKNFYKIFLEKPLEFSMYDNRIPYVQLYAMSIVKNRHKLNKQHHLLAERMDLLSKKQKLLALHKFKEHTSLLYQSALLHAINYYNAYMKLAYGLKEDVKFYTATAIQKNKSGSKSKKEEENKIIIEAKSPLAIVNDLDREDISITKQKMIVESDIILLYNSCTESEFKSLVTNSLDPFLFEKLELIGTQTALDVLETLDDLKLIPFFDKSRPESLDWIDRL